MSYIIAIETAVPEYCHKQELIASFYKNSTTNLSIRRKIDTVARKSGIQTRYSIIPDFSNDPKNFEFFPKNSSLEPIPNLSQRMALFEQHALDLSISAIGKINNFSNVKDSITHIITVTCTGLFAPGLEIGIIQRLKLKSSTQRSSLNFMGCNAAILALNSAHNICQTVPNSKVLVVCTELCTIHFQKNYSDDYILSTALFGDGCAAVLVDSAPPESNVMCPLKITSFASLLIHEGKNEMAWKLSETGFIMNLTSYVSNYINQNIKHLLNSNSAQHINYWAIHPGGKRILDDFMKKMNLQYKDLEESYKVLSKYGNMSSATILFVLKSIMQNNMEAKKNETLFVAAFGPGLSIETMQLKYV